MPTQDDIDELTRRVQAEPDAARRAHLLDVDLTQLHTARVRYIAGCWIVAFALALAVLAMPATRFATLPPAFRDYLLMYSGHRVPFGVLIVFVVFPLAQVVCGLLGVSLRGPGAPRIFLRYAVATAATPALLMVAGLLSQSDPYLQLAIVAGTPLAAAVVSTRVKDPERLVRQNDQSATLLILNDRRMPAIQTLTGGRIRWMVLEITGNLTLWTATALLVIAVPWAVIPVVVGRMVFGVVQHGVQRAGYYRWSIAALAVYAVALAAIAVLLDHGLLFPAISIVNGVVDV